MDIFDLQARIGLDTSEYDEGIDKSEGKFTSFGDSLKNGLSKAGSITTSALSAVASGVKSLATNMVSATSDLANYGDNIDKASQKLGISAQAYQEWEAVMQHSGTSMESMSATFKTLASATQNTTDAQAEAFEKLGISVSDLQNMKTEDVFANVITQLQGMEEGTERTTIATALLGRGAMEMGALLNTSAEDTQAMIDTVNELGGVMSDDAVKASAAFNDSLQDMTTAIDGIKRGVVAEFLPGITQLMNGFTSLISGSDDASAKIVEGFETLANGIKNNIDKVVKVAKTIVPQIIGSIITMLPSLSETAADLLETLASAILDNLPIVLKTALNLINRLVSRLKDYAPLLIDAAVDIVFALADGIIDMLPEIMSVAVDIIITLVDKLTEGDMLDKLIDTAIILNTTIAEGLIDNLPKLIVKAPVIIQRLVDAIVANVPKLLKASWEIIQKLAKGISDNIPYIIESGREILLSFIDGAKQLFTNLVPLGKDVVNKVGEGIRWCLNEAATWGRDLMDNFIGGIKQKWEDLKSAVSDVAQTVKDFIGFSEPKKGPLSNFHTYAPDMIDLFAQGMKENEYKLENQFESSFDFSGNVSAPSAGSHSPSNNIVINITSGVISSDYDARRVAQKMSEQLALLQNQQRKAIGA